MNGGGEGLVPKFKTMYELQGYINFWPEYEPDIEVEEEDYCFVYYNRCLLLNGLEENLRVPHYRTCKEMIKEPKNMWYLGKWRGKSCFAYALEIDQISENALKPVHKTLEWIDYRDARWIKDMELYYIAIKTQQILLWDKNTKYCGCCGNLYARKQDERAKICFKCASIQYPRISPAIIVGIKRGDQMLLAHNANFREGLYSTIAGFVEQGETLEMAVKREIYEEVGIKVKNIRYFQSKPWSSLDSLMLGFIAEYESGEIKVDGKEILDAGWYDKNHLPKVLPDKITTAWCIINEILGLENK